MAAAVDYTVKKYDGVTDIVWTVLSGSGGDKSPAVWRSNTAAGTIGQRPVISIIARDNGPKTARRVDINAVFPDVYTDANTGLTNVRSKIVCSFSAVLPGDTTSATLTEGVAQILHILGHNQTRDQLTSGYAAT